MKSCSTSDGTLCNGIFPFVALGDFWLDSVRGEAIMREPPPFQECAAHLGSGPALIAGITW